MDDISKMTVVLHWTVGNLPVTTNSKQNNPSPPATMQCPEHFSK